MSNQTIAVLMAGKEVRCDARRSLAERIRGHLLCPQGEIRHDGFEGYWTRPRRRRIIKLDQVD